MSIQVQEDEDLPIEDGLQEDKNDGSQVSKIKEILDFLDSSGEIYISSEDSEIILHFAKIGKINFNNFEICLEEFIQKQGEYEHIIDVFQFFGFISKNDINEFINVDINTDRDDLNIASDKNNNAVKNNEQFKFKPSIVDRQVAKRIDFSFATEHSILPFKIVNKVLHIACGNAVEQDVIVQLLLIYNECDDVKKCIVDFSNIAEAIDLIYNEKDELDEVIDKITKTKIGQRERKGHENTIPRELITSLVDGIISNSVKSGASDIHIEPEDGFVRIRYRIDGDMKIIKSLHKDYWSNILVRIKVLAGLNIAENRRPQDGKISTTVYKRQIDCRVSTQPTIYGENVVIRILDKQKGLISLKELGFYPESLKLVEKANERPDGIIIIVGPTGSGKTTTLYSMINQINTPDINIMTLEDPVEYNIPMIRQININEAVGLTFESGMRSLVRQDPDVILVGEIRDKETLQAALRMSMTGHKVFSSLHAIDSIGAIQRLMDIGAETGSLVGNLTSIMSQRLVKKLCKKCKTPQKLTQNIIDEFCLTDAEIKSATPHIHHGCDHCGGSGYKGRIVLAEVLMFNDDLDELVYKKYSQSQLKKYAREHGFLSMSHDAKHKFLNGVVSYEEIKKSIKINF